MTPTLPIPEAARTSASDVIRTHQMRHSTAEKPACACGWVPPDQEFWGDDHRQHVADEVVAAAVPHLQRLENATYTAAEVKVLTREAGEFGYRLGYRLGRRDAGEEIALALEAIPATVYPEDIFPPDGTSVDAQSARVMRFAYPAAAQIARDVVSQEPEDATSGRTDPEEPK